MSQESLIPENLTKEERANFYREMAAIGAKYFADSRRPTLPEFYSMVNDLIEKEVDDLFDTGGLKVKAKQLTAAGTVEIKLLTRNDFLIDTYHLVDGETRNITNYGILSGKYVLSRIISSIEVV